MWWGPGMPVPARRRFAILRNGTAGHAYNANDQEPFVRLRKAVARSSGMYK